jgi:hypothetical protein
MKLLARELQEGEVDHKEALARLSALVSSIPAPKPSPPKPKASLPREADLKIPKGWQQTWDRSANPYPESTEFPGGARKVAWEVEITLKDAKSRAAEAVFEKTERSFHDVKTWEGGGSASLVDVGLRPDFLEDLEQDRRVKSYRYKIVTYW